MKVVIGVTTYGTIPRVDQFMLSLRNNLDPQFETKLVCVDDGTPSPECLRLRARAAQKLGFQFIEHGHNRGIPAAWNTIVQYAAGENAQVVAIFNDDIRLMSPGWLTRLAVMFERNDNLGMVGLPLCNESSFNDADSEKMWGNKPGLVGAAVGCAFAGQPETFLKVENPDGSLGFWDELLSFHEETCLGMRLAQMGFPSYMLPWPPVYHQGGATFGTNPELVWRNAVSYLPPEEFLTYARASAWYVPQYEPYYAQGKFDRMMYSRAMFCKYWDILDMERKWTDPQNGEIVDIYDEPQRYVHRQYVDQLQGRTLHFLNKMGEIETVTV